MCRTRSKTCVSAEGRFRAALEKASSPDALFHFQPKDKTMALTAKQEAFAQAIAGGMNQSDAYRSAYNAGKMKPASINQLASKLASDIKVSSRVMELQAELANKSLWTREQSIAVLAGVVKAGDAKHSDKIGAVKVLNEMQGFNAPLKLDVAGSVSINVHFD